MIRALLMAAVSGMAGWVLVGSWLRGRRALEPRRHAKPEAGLVVRISDAEIVCERPGGITERVRWSDLLRVELVATSRGLRAHDVFWVLQGGDGGCAIPQGATNGGILLESLQALPGFDNEAVIRAMSSSADARWLCWTKAIA